MMRISLAALAAMMLAIPAYAGTIQSDTGLSLQPISFMKIQGWNDDAHDEALHVFQRSCTKLTKLKPNEIYGKGALSSEASIWHRVCEEANQMMPNDPAGARSFFERMFVPFKAGYQSDFTGKLTGYFEPLAQGAWEKKPGYETPVYATPSDLVSGQTYPLTREQIDAGALDGKGLEVMWLSDPVALFFLQVQGSGRVQMDTGETVALRFAAKNNQPYTSIGKVLIEEGKMTRENVSAPAIRSWLHTNPTQAPGIMARNHSYIFFNVARDVEAGPVGAQNVALTPERSMAVDTNFIPLGMPIFLSTTLPETDFNDPLPYQRLMVAQDKGSAILGAVRGDIFFGFGERADALAGNMNAEGEFILLLPEKLVRQLQGKRY